MNLWVCTRRQCRDLLKYILKCFQNLMTPMSWRDSFNHFEDITSYRTHSNIQVLETNSYTWWNALKARCFFLGVFLDLDGRWSGHPEGKDRSHLLCVCCAWSLQTLWELQTLLFSLIAFWCLRFLIIIKLSV
jgi:hypothetical protein